MPQVKLPFSRQREFDIPRGHIFQCGLYRALPKPLQEISQKKNYVLEYLHLIPTEEVGIPQFYFKLSRKLEELKPRNLIYPVTEDIFAHIYPDPEDARDFYISIEPILTRNLDSIMAEVERRLLDFAAEFALIENEDEKRRRLLECLNKICTTDNVNSKIKLFGFNNKEKRIRVTPQELEGIRYLVVRDKLGLGVLEPIIHDPYIEDISGSGIGPIFIEHKIFKGLKTAIVFSTYEELDDFVIHLAERIKKPVTIRHPIADATLPDGSRVNIVYGREVSKRGSNFSIRKFSEIPFSIFELIEFGTLDYLMVAYLSLIIEEGMNIFISGETASGKTTTLNALTTFIPSEAKVVSIEETPELQVPHKNWIREVTKGGRGGERSGQVTMFDLLKAALRQRPNMIIVGEIRGEEGNIAFQAMQTGHGVMSTFHAGSVEKLIQRLVGDPINVPKTYLDNLNAVIIQSIVRLPGGKLGRRVISVCEIVGYDPPSDSFSFVEIFRWNPAEDNFEFVGNLNSYLLEQKIAVKRGIPGHKKRKIYMELERRAKIFEKLHKEKGVKNFYELLQVLGKARQEGLL